MALNAALFDPVLLDRMAAVQQAVADAANALSDDLGERLAAADQLAGADRERATEVARQALAPLLVQAESNPVAPAGRPATEPSEPTPPEEAT